MATTPATGGERFITVDPSADAGNAAGGELHKSQSNEQQQREMSADMARRKLKWVDSIVFCVAFFKWAGNAVGTLASLWATVVLLGGFCSMLSPKDFWFSTVMVFVEATRVFIRNDASINQWLFGSTRAFRWADFSFRPMLVTPIRANIFALTIGMFVSAVPEFRPKIVKSIIEVVLLVIISQMLSRLRGRVGLVLLILPAMAAFVAFNYGFFKGGEVAARPKGVGLLIAWEVGTGILALLAFVINIRCALLHKAGILIPLKVITALALACLPFFQEVLASYYSIFCITVSALLLILSTPVLPLPFLVERRFFLIVDTIMPILFYWSVMFPLPLNYHSICCCRR